MLKICTDNQADNRSIPIFCVPCTFNAGRVFVSLINYFNCFLFALFDAANLH